jgi:hypothetical protein
VTHVFVPNGGAFQCGPGGQLGDGWACAVVPYSNGAYVFKFFNYGGYSVSNWHGTGSVVNLQSGGAAFRIDRLDGSQIHCYAPRQAAYNLVGWEPVWRVRLTASGC